MSPQWLVCGSLTQFSRKAKTLPSAAAGRKRSDRRSASNPEEDLSEQSDEELQEQKEKQLGQPKKKKIPVDPVLEKAKAERTVFVGGVPVSVAKNDKLEKYFSKFGKIGSVRFRSIAMAKLMNPQMRRVGYIKGEFNEKQETCNAYVVFADKASVVLALAENGKDDFQEDFHLRVDTVEPTISHKKSIFVGNLPFDVSDRAVREAFAESGPIEYVRVVRDSVTSLGRGYAYVCFEKREGAKAAAELTNVKVAGRTVRIERCKKPGAEKKDENPSATKKARTAPMSKKKSAGPGKKKGAPQAKKQEKMPQRQRKKLNKLNAKK